MTKLMLGLQENLLMGNGQTPFFHRIIQGFNRLNILSLIFGFFFVKYHRFQSVNCSNNFYHQFTIRNLSANNSIYSVAGYCGVGTEGIHVLSDGVSTTKNSFSFTSFVCKNEPGQWAAPIYKDTILTFFNGNHQ